MTDDEQKAKDELKRRHYLRLCCDYEMMKEVVADDDGIDKKDDTDKLYSGGTDS